MKENLLMFDGIPMEAKKYLANYGFCFNKKACDFAVSMMKKSEDGSSDKKKMKSIEPMTKSEVMELLKRYGVTLEHDCMYDSTYVANMLMADMYKSGIPDEAHLALAIKDVIDDVDAKEGSIFVKWYACCLYNGCPIDWSELI